MVGVLILTHGGTAVELLAAARTIIKRELDNFSALSLDWDESRESARQKIDHEIANLDRGEGVLVLTDLLGGTPTNLSMDLREEGRVEVICGVNLPMVIRLGCSSRPAMELRQLALWIQEKARKSICCGCDLPRSVQAPTVCEDHDG